jgi:PadR family transcriptional regulator AphA
MVPLTTTSYALLSLLNLQPWSGYELAKQMDRSLRYVWPRAVSAIYEEPRNLVAHGLACSRTERQGRRARTVYEITPAGRRALAGWLAQSSLPPRFESEALVRISFPDAGTPSNTLATLDELLVQMEELRAQLEVQVSSYLEPGHGPFPRRLHVIALDARFVTEQVLSLQRWARWAIGEVQRWPSTRRGDRGAALSSLATTHQLLHAARDQSGAAI